MLTHATPESSASSSGFSRTPSSLSRAQTTSTVASSASWGAHAASTPDTSEFGTDGSGAHYKERFSNERFSNGSAAGTRASHGSGHYSSSGSSAHYSNPAAGSSSGGSYGGAGPSSGVRYESVHTHYRPSPPSEASTARGSASASAPTQSRLATQIATTMKGAELALAGGGYDDDEFELPDDLSDDEGASLFANFALLSNIAVWLRDEVPRGTHVKGSIPYPRAFTGKDIVVRRASAARTFGAKG
jgi:hypothetical protein